jgi:hypothetical protein
MATIQKKYPAEAGQYFQAEWYGLRFDSVGCLWFFSGQGLKKGVINIILNTK